MQPSLILARPRSLSVSTAIAEPIALSVLCLVFCTARWCVLDSFWGDSPRWIAEVWRASEGEVPYRDFGWQYPPFAVLFFGSAMRIFGSSFAVVQTVLDVLGISVVMLTWRLGERLLPRPLGFLSAAALACAGAANTNNFALFSIELYTPAIITGAFGILCVLLELVDHLDASEWTAWHCMRLSVGGAIALTSKPEFMLGTAAGLLTWIVLSRDLRRMLCILMLVTAPAGVFYLAMAWFSGPGNLMAGAAGYGMGALFCPWWPTGVGVFGACAALSLGLLIRGAIRTLLGTWTYRDFAGMALGGAIVALYLPMCAEDVPVLQGRLTPIKIAGFLVSTGTLLLPAMWCSIGLLTLSAFRRAQIPPATTLCIVCAIAMSLRGLFSGSMTQLTSVSNAAYPVWFIVGVWLLSRNLRGGGGPAWRSRPELVIALVVALVSGLKAATVMAGAARGKTVIDTGAGPVRLRTAAVAGLPTFLANRLGPNDTLLDLAAGGTNFITRRRSPIFSGQFTALAPGPEILGRDLELIRKAPPTIVIANTGPDFGAAYGICLQTGCSFPRFVWRPDTSACQPAVHFPVLDYVREHYAPIARFGDKLIYTPILSKH